MKTYQANEIKNIALLGNDGAGKTTLTEALLYEAGVIKRRGRITQQNTVSDYFPVEQEYGYSVFSTVFHVEWNNKKLNIIDCPGSDDFVGAAMTALNVTDTAVLLLKGGSGVEVGRQNHFRYTEKLGKPVIFLVNQLDDENCDYDAILEQLTGIYGSKVVPIQYPLETGPGFHSLIDVLLMKKYSWAPEGGAPTIEDVPAEEMERATEMHKALVEAAAEHDETLMEKFFEAGSLTEDEIRKGLSIGISKGEAYPIFCVSAKKDIGVKRLLEFTRRVAPVPTNKEEGAPSIFIYKNAVEQHLGEVSYFKVMSGTITPGIDLEDPVTGGKDRLSAIYAVAGQKREAVDQIHAGDFGCAVKLKNSRANTTLSLPGSGINYDKIVFPASKYECAIKAKVVQDEQKLGDALKKISSQDPTVVVDYNKELRQTILKGNGEQHINIVKWRLVNEFGVDVELFAPKVPYRETITKVATAQYRHKKQSGGAGQFGEVHLLVCPAEGELNTKFKIDGKDTQLNVKTQDITELEWGGKLEFYNCVVGGAIDLGFMPAILKGIKEKMSEGPLTGSYARDIRVFVYDGKMHPVDSKEIAFIIAGRNAFKEAFRNAGPKILEPIYNVTVMTPPEYQGAVMSDLQNRRGVLGDMDSDKGFAILKARVPQAELHRYSTALSSLTAGSASFEKEFADYQPVPGDVQAKLLAEYVAEEAAEE